MLQEAYSGEFTRLSTVDKCHKAVSVQLLDLEIWKRFCEVNNEMIVTKSGRYADCCFYYCKGVDQIFY